MTCLALLGAIRGLSRETFYKNIFKKSLSKFIRPSPNSVFNCYNCKGIKHLPRLCLGLSHLLEHKFKHSFQNTLNPFGLCDLYCWNKYEFFFFTAPCLQIKDALSWAQLMILTVLWQIQMIRCWFIFFFAVKLL